MKHHKFLLFTIISIFVSQISHAQESYKGKKEDLHLYLLIGQSNMSGRAKITDEHKTIPKNIYLLNAKNQFEHATHPLNQYSTIRKGLGMQKLNIGYSFSKAMLKADKNMNIGLIVNAKGGSKIEEWDKDTKFYKDAIARTQAAQKVGTLKGILWHQGESNNGAPDDYDKKLAKLIKNLRKDLKDKELPFVAGQIVDKGTEKINDQIAALPKKVKNTAFVSSKGLKTYDRWHFDTESLLKLGEGYAKEMLELQK